MQRGIEIGDKTVKLLSNGATPLIYKMVFRKDAMTILPKLMKAYSEKLKESGSSEEAPSLVEIDGVKVDQEVALAAIIDTGLLDFCQELAYIMAMQAEKTTTECTRLTPDGYIEWMANFELNQFMFATKDIIEIYQQNLTSTAKQKKNPAL